MRIPFVRPDLPPVETWAPLLSASYDAAQFTNFGPLERRFADACRSRYAARGYDVVSVTNATAGLTAALLATAGKRAIIPAFTFAATLHAVLQAGMEPVLCDADEATWELSLDHLETLLKTRAIDVIVPVRSFGLVRDQAEVFRLAEHYGTRVVIDGAASFGHPGRAGAIGSAAGEIEVVSLHATKPFSIGEGGLVFAPAAVATQIAEIANFGLRPDRSFGDGGNMKLDDIRAAIGLAMLDRIDALVTRREAMAHRWASLIARAAPDHRLPLSTGPTPWQCYPVLMASPDVRQQAEDAFAHAGVAARRYYYPTLASGYRGTPPIALPRSVPTAEALAERMLCVPVIAGLTDTETQYLFRIGEKAFAGEADLIQSRSDWPDVG